ncbi:MAG TPA: DUF3147 family protein [Sphingomicrobium sp.]|nr:DUF3147 family protein [Sphingomicrobium sp.]
MLYIVAKAALSGLLIAFASEVARRSPAWGGLIVALPLTSVLAMIWLWRDTRDAQAVSALSEAAFWFVLPTLPMFLVIPAMLRAGWSFWAALLAGAALTIGLYLAMAWVGPRFGVRL